MNNNINKTNAHMYTHLVWGFADFCQKFPKSNTIP